MRSRSKNKTLIIVGIFLILLLSVSIGYAYLSKTLTINGVTDINKSSWIIYFDDAKEKNGSVEATKELTIDEEKHKIDFGLTLEKPGDFYEFQVDTVNDGTVDAMIDYVDKLGMDESIKKYISYTATYLDGTPIKHCDLLAAGTKERIKIRVEFIEVDNKEDLPNTDLDLTLELQLNYSQADSCAVKPDIKPIIHLDLDGGEYEGKTSEIEITGNKGDKVELPIPTKEGYTFEGWEDEEGNIIENNQIEVGDQETNLKAVWLLEGEAVAQNMRTSKQYASLQRALNEAQENDEILLLKDIEESPINTNPNSIELNLNNNKVTGSLTNKGTLSLTLGTIENTGTAIINEGDLTLKSGPGYTNITSTTGTAIVNNGILTLGDKTSYMAPIYITGSTFGLEQNGVFNYYGSPGNQIKGDIAIKGGYDDTIENYVAFVSTSTYGNDSGKQIATLVSISEAKGRAGLKEIPTHNNEIYYYQFNDAVKVALLTGDTIYVDHTYGTGSFTLNENESLTVDLNGSDSFTFSGQLTNNGTLSLIDSSEGNGRFMLSSSKVENNGTLNIEGSSAQVRITNNNVLNIENSTIEAVESNSASPIENNGTLNIENSTLNSPTNNSLINNNGTLDIKSSNISGGNYAVTVNKDDINIDNNSYLNAKSGYAVDVPTEKKFTVTDGNVEGIHNQGELIIKENAHITSNSTQYTYAIEANGSRADYTDPWIRASINIEGGIIESDRSAINLLTAVDLVMNGGLIHATSIGIDDYTQGGSNTITINSGKIIVDDENDGYGIRGPSGYSEVIMNGGEIRATNGIISFNRLGTVTLYGGLIETKKYGVNTGTINVLGDVTINAKNESGTGIGLVAQETINIQAGKVYGSTYGISLTSTSNPNALTIGKKDGVVNQNSPEIIGDLYGIYGSQSFPFYDGVIKGQTASCNVGIIRDIEDMSVVIETIETIEDKEYRVTKLTEMDEFTIINENTNQKYTTLAQALEEVQNNETLKLIADSSFSSDTVLEEEKNIIIDINGYKLDAFALIQNSANLTLKSSEEEGRISTYNDSGKPFLVNTGTLTINNLKIKSYSNSSSSVLNNSRVMTIQQTELEDTTVYNSGDLEIDGITIKGNGINGSAIQNSGDLNITNSSINGDWTYGIYINGGEVTLNNTIISLERDNSCYGIYSNDEEAKTTVIGGKISATSSMTSNSGADAIYINKGELILGEKEPVDSPNYGTENANVSTESPLIKAVGKYGYGLVLTNNSIVKYYDGKIMGSTTAISAPTGLKIEVEIDYEITMKTEENTGYKYVILEHRGE